MKYWSYYRMFDVPPITAEDECKSEARKHLIPQKPDVEMASSAKWSYRRTADPVSTLLSASTRGLQANYRGILHDSFQFTTNIWKQDSWRTLHAARSVCTWISCSSEEGPAWECSAVPGYVFLLDTKVCGFGHVTRMTLSIKKTYTVYRIHSKHFMVML